MGGPAERQGKMGLRLHNTARRTTEDFVPRDPKAVGMYVCGPTVYDSIHIGNARPLVVFDVLFRLLRAEYGAENVTYVRNITDIDDKINARAAERGEPIEDLTERTTAQFHADVAALGSLEPTVEPRATDHIPEMLALIADLIARGHAYEADGHVLFHVPSWDAYGAFAHKDRDEQVAGARVEVAPYKRDPADFVLWKPSTPDLPGWDSPWGRGRPGWHIECSAMSAKYLGNDFDIHGGGLDLIFPHHQNEIAQSCCAHPDSGFARYWVHNGFLMSEGEKMAKSLGNFYTVKELLDEFTGEALRLVLLQTHYRAPLDFTKDKAVEAKATLDRMYGAIRAGPPGPAADVPGPVLEALEDDLNTSRALAHMHELATRLNKDPSGPEAASVAGALRAAGAVLGLLEQDPEAWFKGAANDAGEIEALIGDRLAARAAKDYAAADRIRDDLKARGVMLEDRPDGTTDWRRA